MTKSFEVLAVMPETTASPPDNQLRFSHAGGYTAVLANEPRKLMTLPQSRKAALSHAANKQRLLEACMPLGTLLVMRPQFFLQVDDVDSLVAANRVLFDQLVLKLRNKVQYQITISWDAATVLTRFRTSSELAPLFQDKRTTQEELQSAVASLAQRLGNDVTDILGSVAHEHINLPLVTDMLANTVVLIDITQTGKLDQAVVKIDEIWSEGLQIKQIGPAPAASFALLDPIVVTRAQVNKTLQNLDLCKMPNAGELANIRKEALLRTPKDAASIRRGITVLDAALRVDGIDRSFAICDVHAEDQAAKTVEKRRA